MLVRKGHDRISEPQHRLGSDAEPAGDAQTRTGPAVDPVCLEGAMPRRARRVSAYNRSQAGIVGRRASLKLHPTLNRVGASELLGAGGPQAVAPGAARAARARARSR